jgi:hypothetical protein
MHKNTNETKGDVWLEYQSCKSIKPPLQSTVNAWPKPSEHLDPRQTQTHKIARGRTATTPPWQKNPAWNLVPGNADRARATTTARTTRAGLPLPLFPWAGATRADRSEDLKIMGEGEVLARARSLTFTATHPRRTYPPRADCYGRVRVYADDRHMTRGPPPHVRLRISQGFLAGRTTARADVYACQSLMDGRAAGTVGGERWRVGLAEWSPTACLPAWSKYHPHAHIPIHIRVRVIVGSPSVGQEPSFLVAWWAL